MENAKEAFGRMESLKSWFLETLDGMNPAKTCEPLGPDEWSLAQVIEHLMIVERGMLVGLARAKEPMPAPDAATMSRRQEYRELLASGTRYDVPSPAALPGEMPDPSALGPDWDRVRQKMSARIESGGLPGPDILVFDHPVGGPMNAEESIAFLADHLMYHKLRVSEFL